MASLTHIQKVRFENYNGIVLLKGETPLGAPIYAYVKADLHDVEEMTRAYKEGRYVDFSKYKGILKSDWGKEPTENVKKYMERTYNFVHQKPVSEEN